MGYASRVRLVDPPSRVLEPAQRGLRELLDLGGVAEQDLRRTPVIELTIQRFQPQDQPVGMLRRLTRLARGAKSLVVKSQVVADGEDDLLPEEGHHRP